MDNDTDEKGQLRPEINKSDDMKIQLQEPKPHKKQLFSSNTQFQPLDETGIQMSPILSQNKNQIDINSSNAIQGSKQHLLQSDDVLLQLKEINLESENTPVKTRPRNLNQKYTLKGDSPNEIHLPEGIKLKFKKSQAQKLQEQQERSMQMQSPSRSPQKSPSRSPLKQVVFEGADKLQQESSDANLHHNGPINWRKRKMHFAMFLYVSIFLSYDGGIIPVSIENVQTDMGINNKQTALLSSLVYFGIASGSLMVQPLFNRFKSTRILAITLACNLALNLILALSHNLYLMYACRFLMGICHAFWVCYGPVWVNYFAPLKQATMWIGMLLGFSPLGIIVGYLCTGILVRAFDFSYRISFGIQGLALFPGMFYVFFQQEDEIDVLYRTKAKLIQQKIDQNEQKKSIQKAEVQQQQQQDENNTVIGINNLAGFIESLKILWKNKIFVNMSLSLCMLFFIVYGIQFWSTDYLLKIFQLSSMHAMILYIVATVTAPVLGVIFGGKVADKLGGYKGDNMIKSIKLCSLFSIICVMIAIPAGFTYSIWYFYPLFWLLVFFGGGMVPPGTAIAVSCVPKQYHSAASSIAQLLYNLVGYFLSPVFSAFIMDQYKDPNEGMMWGFRANLWMTLLGLFFLINSYLCYTQFRYKHREMFDPPQFSTSYSRIKQAELDQLKKEYQKQGAALIQ